MKLERPRPLGQTGMKQTGRPERVWGGGPSLVPVCPWVSPDQVQVVLSPMAGPETILRAATHGLLLGALRGDGPLPEELDKLRNRVRAGPEKESWVIVRDMHHVLDKLFPKFLKGLQDAGWRTEKHQLEVDEWRATWLPCPEKKVL